MSFEGTSIIELLISLVLIYALLSILVSILVEAVNHQQKSRGKLLKKAITGMLNDPANLEYGELFFSHHMISGINNKAMKRPPQYVSASMFADVLMDIISAQTNKTVAISKTGTDEDGEPSYEMKSAPSTNEPEELKPALRNFKVSLDAMADSPLRDLLASFLDKSEGNYTAFKGLLESWYEDQMDRVSGWYKSLQSKKFLIAGFIVAITLNVDSIHLVKVLSLNKELTSNLVNMAEGIADDYVALTDEEKEDVEQQLALFKNQISTSLQDTTTQVRDTSALNAYIKGIDILQAKLDSLESEIEDINDIERQQLEQTRMVLTIASELKLPLGWDQNYAPWSWVVGGSKFEHLKVESESLESYLKTRNAYPEASSVIWYLLGICISGFALSFGAPFWFETLIKLINVRRAGMKPASRRANQ